MLIASRIIYHYVWDTLHWFLVISLILISYFIIPRPFFLTEFKRRLEKNHFIQFKDLDKMQSITLQDTIALLTTARWSFDDDKVQRNSFLHEVK